MHQPLEASRKWWVLLTVGVGTFMSALDASVVNTLLPVVQRAFGVSVAAIEWVVTVYLLLVSGVLLTFGRLGDLRGHRPVYLIGFAVFIVASALCGLAPSAVALVAFRGIQALGAAMLFANSPAILTRNFPAEQRGQALGMQASLTYLGLTAGPSLGGWLATTFGWRSVFYINVPVGLVALALAGRFIPQDAPAEQPEPFDVPGALTFMLGLVALLLALNQGHAWGWGSPAVVGCFAVSALGLAGFSAIERRTAAPMLDLSLFRRLTFTAATTSAILNYLCVYSIVFLLPFYLIEGRGLTAASAGLVLTAQPAIMAIAAPVSGFLSDRIGSRVPATAGMTILAVGLWNLSRLGPHAPLAHVAFGLVVTGLGTGIFGSPNNSALMGSAPRHRQGIAAGILAGARNVGMVLGVALAAAVYTTVLASAPGDAGALFRGVDAGLRVAAGIAVLGAVAAVVR